jgi:O-antigen/teichoic acid export membrane protein
MGKLAGHISRVFLADATVFILSIVSGIVLARGLEASERGLYALAFSAVSLVSAILLGGMNVSSTYMLASKQIRSKQIVGSNIVWMALSGMLVFPVLLVIKPIALKGLDGRLMLVTGLMVPFMVAENLFMGILIGIHDFANRNRIQIFQTALKAGLLALMLFVLRGKAGQAFSATAVALIAATVLAFLIILLKIGMSFRIKGGELKRIFGYSFKIYPAAVAGLVAGQISIFFLNSLNVTKTDIGSYAIATANILPCLFLLPNAIANVIFPKLSASSQQDQKTMVPLLCRCSFLTAVGSCVIAAIFARLLIPLVFGHEYESAVKVVYCLLPGAALIVIGKVISQALNASGHPHYTSVVSVSTVVIMAILNMMFIPAMGINGAGIAFSLSYFCNAILILSFYSWVTGSHVFDVVIFRFSDIKLMYKALLSLLRVTQTT